MERLIEAFTMLWKEFLHFLPIWIGLVVLLLIYGLITVATKNDRWSKIAVICVASGLVIGVLWATLEQI